MLDRIVQRALAEQMDSGCFAAFNPLSREDFEATVAGWVGALLVLADHLVAHPHASAASSEAEQQQLPEPQTPPASRTFPGRRCGCAPVVWLA